MHAAPVRSDPVRRPPLIEDLAEEGPARTGVVNDPPAGRDSLAEPLHHVMRMDGLDRLPGEVEVRSPSRWVRALTDAKSLELELAGLALPKMRFQRNPLRQPDVLIEERREQLASVLAIHGTGHPQLCCGPAVSLKDTPDGLGEKQSEKGGSARRAVLDVARPRSLTVRESRCRPRDRCGQGARSEESPAREWPRRRTRECPCRGSARSRSRGFARRAPSGEFLRASARA